MALIECVPNVSEGRRADVIAALAGVVTRVPDVHLLDLHSDPVHHRSVFTMAGSADGVAAGVLALVDAAVHAIDLRTHTGAHPRVGAVDVIPFIPLQGATMADCVALARRVGAAMAGRVQLPVWLYEHAATSPGRQRLELLRRGGFEQLATTLAGEDRVPDFGPRRPHPTAGASVVGAREILIAFNVQLRTDRLDVARAIATAIRERDGGLPHLKAMGLALPDRGVVQVSMNLTRWQVTGLRTAFEAVCDEARRHGVEVADSELVGLVPEAALDGTSLEALRVPVPAQRPTIEARLAACGA